MFGLQCHASGCNFHLEWFVWINGTQGTRQTPRFGNWGHARRSMGPKRSLERVFFSLKPPCGREVQRHVLVLHCHPSGCTFRLERFPWINGTGGPCPTSSFGEWVHAKSLMGPKRWLEVVLFDRKSPCRRGIQWPLMPYISTQVTLISGCSSLRGSMGPRAHTKYHSQESGSGGHSAC